KDPKALAHVIRNLSDKELLQAPDVEAVFLERLERKTMDLNARSMALFGLAKLHQTDRASEAIAALQRFDAQGGAISAGSDLGLLLASNPASDLTRARLTLAGIAGTAQQAAVRRAAYAAL